MRLLALGLVARALGQLQLQHQRRKRRPQLVRRIGDELALLRERGAKAREEAVQRADERLDLLGDPCRFDGLERFRAAARHDLRRRFEESHLASHQAPDEPAQERQRHHERKQRAAGRREGELIARGNRLRDLDREAALLDCEDAEAPVAGREVAETQLHGARNIELRMRGVDALAVGSPDLDHEFERILALQDLGQLARRIGPVAQRECQLPQLIVEDLVGGVARLEENHRGGREPAREDARQEPEQQSPPH